MRRVLLVAYYFPPSVDAGAKRALGFFRHLHEHGWEPTVLTVEGGNYATADGEPKADPAQVVRVRESLYPWQRGAPAGRAAAAASDRPGGRGSLARRLVRSALYVPDAWRGFHVPALEAALRLHGERSFDAVWTTSSPWTLLRTGAALRRHGLPWVADLRDLWTRTWNDSQQGPLRRGLDAHLERRWLSRASAITTASAGQAALVRRDAFGPPVSAVRNGYLTAADPSPPDRVDERFRLVHAGKVYAHADLSSRPLLDVLSLWKERAPDEVGRLVVDLYGRVDPEFGDEVSRRGLGEVVRFHGLVSPERAARELRGADVIVGMSPRDHPEIVPTKTFDALGALVPMLMLAPPDGEAAAILRDVDGGATFAPGDASGAVEWLRRRLAAGPEGVVERAGRRERSSRYAYSRLSGELAAVLDSVAG